MAASWRPLGTILGASWSLLGASRGLMAASWGLLEAFWKPRGASWAPFGAILEEIDQRRGWGQLALPPQEAQMGPKP
eukprot:9469304-Pyramimonas_sp.AAC.1